MDKWEYCAVGPLSTDLRPVREGAFCEIWCMTDIGIQLLPQVVGYPSQDNVQYVAQLLWLLGEEGWELAGSGAGNVAIGPGTGETGHMLYFKRKKQEPGP